MMSLFSQVESGTSWQRSRFSKSISKGIRYDCRFGELVPVLRKFCLPGDVWRVGGDALVRFQPMLSPTLTRNTLKVRYFFVPLRLLETNTELIITGSQNGKLYESTLPTFRPFVDNNSTSGHVTVPKYGFWDYMGIQTGDYSYYRGTVDRSCLPAMYWHKAYARIWFDYYRDENLQSSADFETWYTNDIQNQNAEQPLLFVNLRKDYFTSSLPWQLKGVAPAINVVTGQTWNGTFTPNFGNDLFGQTQVINSSPTYSAISGMLMSYDRDQSGSGLRVSANTTSNATDFKNAANQAVQNYLNRTQNVNVSTTTSTVAFNADELRTMMAQTRVFERLARCGSRYTEYLRANFGTAPADDTLQRPQYLGGWSLPIVTTEVLQTAEDGDNKVGTMRGHGITRGGNQINTFHCKEFGIIFGLAHVIPDTEYTTGISRELTYKSRFDFFNPSFQHLSEQEVRKGELYIGGESADNDTFGFQAYANELRTDVDRTVGDLRDGLGYWNQALHFGSRPALNEAFIKSENHLTSFNAPFGFVDGDTARPCIVHFQNYLDVYRPMVRYSTPGLVDHL